MRIRNRYLQFGLCLGYCRVDKDKGQLVRGALNVKRTNRCLTLSSNFTTASLTIVCRADFRAKCTKSGMAAAFSMKKYLPCIHARATFLKEASYTEPHTHDFPLFNATLHQIF
mgnify:CR=1 FL=1